MVIARDHTEHFAYIISFYAYGKPIKQDYFIDKETEYLVVSATCPKSYS